MFVGCEGAQGNTKKTWFDMDKGEPTEPLAKPLGFASSSNGLIEATDGAMEIDVG